MLEFTVSGYRDSMVAITEMQSRSFKEGWGGESLNRVVIWKPEA